MKTKLPDSIETVEDIKSLLSSLIENNEMYHIDDDATEIGLFTFEEGTKLNELIAQSWAIKNPWQLVEVHGAIGTRIRQDDDTEHMLSYLAPQMKKLLEEAEPSIFDRIIRERISNLLNHFDLL